MGSKFYYLDQIRLPAHCVFHGERLFCMCWPNVLPLKPFSIGPKYYPAHLPSLPFENQLTYFL
jgi:hypothetical protein